MSVAGSPRAAVGAVVLRGPEVLLVRRGQPPKAGHWTLPGGKIEPGERAREAVARELREECAIEVEVTRLLDAVDLIERDASGSLRYHYVVLDFLARVRGGTLRAGSDVAEARWVERGRLADYALSDDACRLIERAFETAG